MSTVTAYPMDNQHGAAADHHRYMAELLDPFTRRRILDLATMPNWRHAHRALEVGAGHGSIALWLADRFEHVVALDLQPDRIPEHPRLVTVAHDLTADTDLAEVVGDSFDLIHARLTLSHLPNRRTILHRLAGLLAPGGTLLVEDWAVRWDATLDEVVIAAPSPEAAELYYRYQQASGRVFRAAGVDPAWARCGAQVAMLEEGLADVTTVIHGDYWRGGGPGLRMLTAVAAQARPKLAAEGMTEAELDQLPELLADPRLLVHPHLLYSTSGIQPPT